MNFNVHDILIFTSVLPNQMKFKKTLIYPVSS